MPAFIDAQGLLFNAAVNVATREAAPSV